MSKAKQLREEAGELLKKMEVVTLECRAKGMSPDAATQEEFRKMQAEVEAKQTEADGFDMLDAFDGKRLQKLKKEDVRFSTHVNTREKASLDLALRSFAGRDAGLSTAEWDAHADQMGMGRRFYQDRLETRAWATGTSGGASEWVPTTLGSQIHEVISSFGGLLGFLLKNNGTFTTENGDPFNYPTFDPTGLTGSQIPENSADTEETSQTTGEKAYASYGWTSGIAKLSYQVIRDAKFPLVPIVTGGLAKGLARGIAASLLTGTGSSAPEGILTNIVTGVTTASTTAFTYSELLSLIYSIDEYHMERGSFVVSRSAMQSLQGLVDTLGRPLFNLSMREGAPNTLLGYPIYVDVSMPTVAATHKPIIFGNVAEGYKVRFVGDLQVRSSTERYWEFNQTAIVANQYWDARAIDTAAYKCLTMHA